MPEANAEIRHLPHARELDGVNHALDAALAESARHQDAVVLFQLALQPALLETLGLDPVDIHLHVMRDPAVQQRFFQALIRILVLHVFADQRDIHLVPRILHAVQHGRPFLQIARAARRPDADAAG